MNIDKQLKIKKLTMIALITYYSGVIAFMVAFCVVFYRTIWWFSLYALVTVLIHLQWIVIVFITKNEYNHYFTPFYFTFLAAILVPLTVVCWQLGVYMIIILYVLMPAGLMFHYLSKYIVYAIIYFAFFITMSIFIAEKWVFCPMTISNTTLLPSLQIIILSIVIIFLAIFIGFYNYIQSLQHEIVEEQKALVKIKNDIMAENEEKLREIYNNILAYFNKHKPYQQYNFNQAILARALDTSVGSISRAVNLCANNDFRSFVNKYRIEQVQQMLDQGALNKFSMQYIYSSAGFSVQSTFNDVFKKSFGMTPSEYAASKMLQ